VGCGGDRQDRETHTSFVSLSYASGASAWGRHYKGECFNQKQFNHSWHPIVSISAVLFATHIALVLGIIMDVLLANRIAGAV